MKKKVLFVCKRRNNSYDPSGISYGLLNSCRFVGEALESEFADIFDYKIVVVTDNNDIEREVVKYGPTHVVIEALWVVPAKMSLLVSKYTNITWTVRLHSKAAFIANEGVAFEWMHAYNEIADDHPNLSISANDRSFAKDMTRLFAKKIQWLPNIYNPSCDHEQRGECDFGTINIGCFGAIRPLKNQLEQAIAAIAYADSQDLFLKFHMNTERVEQRGESILKNIRALFAGIDHELVEHSWYQHHDFLKVVRKMDIGMQVSFSESFNIIAADFVGCNVPVVVSNEIVWANWLYKVSTTDTKAIVNKLCLAHALSPLGIHGLNKRGLKKFNRRAVDAWLGYVFKS